jgi:PilZ domain
MKPPRLERRSQNRIATRLRVSIRPSDGVAAATVYTRDVSTNGIFVYADSTLKQGSELEMVLILPPELTQGERRWVCCQATVVRVEEGNDQNVVGVAASIRNMQVLPEIVG